MIKFRSVAFPKPSEGKSFEGQKDLVVPDQSLTLREILERFTRGEPVAVGQDAVFDDDSDEDLEKLSHMDLVDKAEYVEKLKQVQKAHERQEKERERKEKEDAQKAAEEAVNKRIRLAARKIAKESSGKSNVVT